MSSQSLRPHAEVCALSGRVFPPKRPYPSHYRMAFAFSAILYPLRRFHSLRLEYRHSAERVGLTLLLSEEF
jgi:hypothetical protein